MQLLSVDSPFYKFLVRFWDMVKLNFLWVLFSLPIVTIGAATVAAYTVTLRMVDDQEGDVVKQFIQGFKVNFKQGTVMGLLTIVVGYGAYLSFEIFEQVETNPVIFLIMGMIVLFGWLLHVTYAFPLCARYDNGVIKTFRIGYDIAVKYFVRTLLLWVVLAIEIIVFTLTSTTLLFGLLIGPACLLLTVSGFAIRFFKAIEEEEKGK